MMYLLAFKMQRDGTSVTTKQIASLDTIITERIISQTSVGFGFVGLTE